MKAAFLLLRWVENSQLLSLSNWNCRFWISRVNINQKKRPRQALQVNSIVSGTEWLVQARNCLQILWGYFVSEKRICECISHFTNAYLDSSIMGIGALNLAEVNEAIGSILHSPHTFFPWQNAFISDVSTDHLFIPFKISHKIWLHCQISAHISTTKIRRYSALAFWKCQFATKATEHKAVDYWSPRKAGTGWLSRLYQ